MNHGLVEAFPDCQYVLFPTSLPRLGAWPETEDEAEATAFKATLSPP
jgi:hypothetical protein